MATPKISIIVPVYNVELYLRQCLDTLVTQTLKDIEIICVNDGSRDRSSEILKEYANQKDSRVKVINQENTGVSGARNKGLKVATGEYIMFVDSDDWVDVEICEELYNAALTENADCVMCSYTKEFGKKSVINHIFTQNYIVFDKNEIKYKFHRRLFGLVEEELARPEDGDLIVSVCMQIFKKELIEAVEFVDLKLIGTAEDALYQMYAYQYCNKFVYIDIPLYHYRKTNDCSLTSTHKSDLFEKWQNLFDMMDQFINEYCDEQIYYEALSNRIAISMIGLGLNEIFSKDKALFQKAKRLKQILKTERYQIAYKQLKFIYFPFHWKVFFGLCKYKMTRLLVLMLFSVNYFRRNI
ncbi:MAG: glycosyltransferase [Eubacteriales bacterium]|nr:glycosyltransferase [Eubacteriales bacterium]